LLQLAKNRVGEEREGRRNWLLLQPLRHVGATGFEAASS
jgi:hypothetical protein